MSWFPKLQTVAAVLLSMGLSPAFADIPASERAVLEALYTSTNGAGWATQTGWGGGAGTECTWYGITCENDGTDDHVVSIELPDNKLSGPLPELADLTHLRGFIAYSTNGDGSSSLTSLPPDLASLTTLRSFSVAGNGSGLTGTIPSLAALTDLQFFRVNHNGLTGGLPSLAGLNNLQYFWAHNNALGGALPANLFGTGLPALVEFRIESNNLSGQLPNTLNQSTGLVDFRANTNQLTGPIPALMGLASLRYFLVNNNQLSGQIPSLNGLGALEAFSAGVNRLTGPLPPLTGQGLNALQRFRVHYNQLSGPMPADLTGLSLTAFMVGNNQLTGNPPTAPATLIASDSNLCTNNLSKPYPDSPAWDNATGSTPWWSACAAATAAAAPVPALSDWALVLLGCMLAGVAALRRSRRA